MKNLLAIAVVMLFTAFAAQAVTDNCNASATGTFTFQVEQAIGLIGGNPEIDLGGICPGCTKTFTDQCATWIVTGGETCFFHAAMTNPATITGITVTGGWQASVDNGVWGSVERTGNYAIDPSVSFRVCVSSIGADCNVDAGNYSLVYGLNVNYICSLQ